ncbi:MAG: hypothetical protein ABIG85_02015 [Chloroflexota bacterium]
MAVVQVTNAASREAYEAISKLIDFPGNRPAGLVIHTASEETSGSVLIVDVWESDAAMDAFERERLLPAFQAGGMAESMQQTPPTRHQTFQVVRG